MSDDPVAPDADGSQVPAWPPSTDFHRPVHCLLGLPIDAVTLAEAVAKIEHCAARRIRCFLSTPNLNFVIAADSPLLAARGQRAKVAAWQAGGRRSCHPENRRRDVDMADLRQHDHVCQIRPGDHERADL